MLIHADSHLDHALTAAQIAYLLETFRDRTAFFIETIDLPEEIGTVPCMLYGPIMGDPPVTDDQVGFARRGGRAWSSRMHSWKARPTRTITVIAGAHADLPCVMFTAFGGPLAPQEPGDPGCKDPEASAAFWREHAI